MKYAPFIVVLALLFSCSTTKETTQSLADQTTESTENNQGDYIEITAKEGELGTSDPFTIEDVQLNGNYLEITASYSGGCEAHQFEFIGSRAIMKSYPPKRAVQLIHHANEDHCRQYITQKIRVDLRKMVDVEKAGNKMYLLLEGWKDEILYTYE